MKKIILSVLILLIVSTGMTVYADTSLNYVKGTVNESGTLSSGVAYETFTAATYTDFGTLGEQNISVVTAESDAPFKIITWSKITGDSIVGVNLIDLATDFELNNPGYEVLAGINGDYFNMSTYAPINAFVRDGDVIKSTNFYLDRYFSVGFTNDDNLFVTNKSNDIESKYSLTIYNDDNHAIKEIELQGLNQIPSENKVTAYYKTLNDVDISDATMMEAEITESTSLGPNYITAVITEEVDRVYRNNEIITIVSKNIEINSYLELGYNVRIQKYLTDVNKDIDNLIGVGSQPLEEDQIKEFEDINDQSVDFAEARHPRTSFGFTNTGDFILATFDGRQEDMDGVNLREMAKVMQDLGCDNAFNLDGGGSSQLVINDDGVFRMLNSPSDSSPYRNVANGVFIVRPKVMVGITISSETANSFNLDYTVAEAIATIDSTTIYLDDEEVSSDSYSLIFEDLNEGEIFFATIEIVLFDVINGYTSYFITERIDLSLYVEDEPPHVKESPSNFTLDITNQEGIFGFNVFIEFDDPDDTFVKMYLVYDEIKLLCSKAIGGYSVDVVNAEDKKRYDLKIEYHYIIDAFTPVFELTDSTYFFTYNNPPNTTTTTTTTETIVTTGIEPNEGSFIPKAAIYSFVGVMIAGISAIFVVKSRKIK